MNDQQIEQELQTRGLTAPRITPDHIDGLLSRSTVGFWQPEGTTLTICVLQLPNGFCVTGENSCVSPENWQPDLGQKYAFEKARDKVWELEGYRLKTDLYCQNSIPEEPEFVILAEPENTTAVELRGAFQPVDPGANVGALFTGEIGTIDCGVKIVTDLSGRAE